MRADRDHPVIRRAELFGPDGVSVSAAVGEYLRQTEAEKRREGISSEPLGKSGALPEHYRAEVDDPVAAYDDFDVLVADVDGVVVGVVVVAPRGGDAEIKRLWAAPALRGRGIGSALLDAAVAASDGPIRLSVWDWRIGARRLYESRGFREVPSWDGRDRLVCMIRQRD
ncbi:GNAT family N-acetyltransferase [Microbacterium sp. K24]|uniref:GNAT family N-acetyltransferase n=1 Tax=Microbacterium sp. K24 TaxID=2305446 RepID=UPI00109C7AA8|nr:GNAT family N-acetyltransferase [Microbacterium sp. K24]